jgi:hypothetical protein
VLDEVHDLSVRIQASSRRLRADPGQSMA